MENSLFCLHIFEHCNNILATAIRLVDGPSEFEGRVEVYHMGRWGDICKIYHNYNEKATVAKASILSVEIRYYSIVYTM